MILSLSLFPPWSNWFHFIPSYSVSICLQFPSSSIFFVRSMILKIIRLHPLSLSLSLVGRHPVWVASSSRNPPHTPPPIAQKTFGCNSSFWIGCHRIYCLQRSFLSTPAKFCTIGCHFLIHIHVFFFYIYTVCYFIFNLQLFVDEVSFLLNWFFSILSIFCWWYFIKIKASKHF